MKTKRKSPCERGDVFAKQGSLAKRQKFIHNRGVDEVDGFGSTPDTTFVHRRETRSQRSRRLNFQVGTADDNNNNIGRRSNCPSSVSASSYDDVDGICAMNSLTTPLSECPVEVPGGYVNEKPAVRRTLPLFRKPKPETHWDIVIPHPQQTDTPLGDYFGADLATFYDPQKNYFRHHLLRKITKDGVAEEMRFRNDDELVMLNDEFVPRLTHPDVKTLFCQLQVDGHTRFSIVCRRNLGNKWQWYKTSAILCPVEEGKEQGNHVKEMTCDALPLNGICSQHRVKLRCLYSNRYLDIKDSAISVSTFCGNNVADSSKQILQTDVFKEDPVTCEFVWRSSLQGTVGHCCYLGLVSMVNGAQPVSSPFWFHINANGGANTSFKHQDMYLATEGIGRVVASTAEHYFVPFLWIENEKEAYDEVDGLSSVRMMQ